MSIQVAIIPRIALVIFCASSIAACSIDAWSKWALGIFIAMVKTTCSIEADLSKEALGILSASSIADTCSVDAMLSRFALVMVKAGVFLDFFKMSLTSFEN